MKRSSNLLTLTTSKLDQLKPTGKRYTVWDSQTTGLGIKVGSSGLKSWITVLTFRDGRQRTVTLGHFPELSLDDARLRTMAYRREAKEGRDPVKKERVIAVSVEQAIQCYLAQKLGTPRYLHDVERRLSHAVKTIGKVPLAEVEASEWRHTYGPLIQKAPVEAKATRDALRTFLRWAADNPDMEFEAVPHLPFPTKAAKPKQQRVIRPTDLGKLWKASDQLSPRSRALVQAIILTGARRGEIGGLETNDIDLHHQLISLQGTKNGTSHQIPLTGSLTQSIEPILITGRRYVYGQRGSAPFSGFSKLKSELTDLSGVEEWNWHAFRRTFVTYCAEYLQADVDLIARCVNHKTMQAGGGGQLAGYYQQTRLRERRDLMEQWAAFVELLGAGIPVEEAAETIRGNRSQAAE